VTTKLYAADAYLQQADAQVIAHTEQGGIVLDQSLFYPTGGDAQIDLCNPAAAPMCARPPRSARSGLARLRKMAA